MNGSRIEKFMTSVLALRNGSMKAVEGSGISFMSDSWIAWKPRMDDPSNIRPSSNTDWSNDSTGILKCCITPGRSINRTSTNFTPSALMKLSTSVEFLNTKSSLAFLRICPVGLSHGVLASHGGWCLRIPETIGKGHVMGVSLLFRQC